jgi:16S rRNA (cytidine1402-2'-O)-methyltransferase
VTRVLLDRYAIAQRPYAYHEHNADAVGPKLIARLAGGESVALVSDAGTPLVSDPGYRLAQTAIEAGLRVIPIPGASAPLAALVASGLSNEAFLFAGFLPQKDKARRDRLAEFADMQATLMFFESPNRIGATLAAAADVLGPDRKAAVCRELTKTFEEVRRAPLAALAAAYAQEDTPKGEIVVVVGPPLPQEASIEDVDALLLSLGAELGASKAATEVAKMTGGRKADLYRRLMALKGDGG